ncbi:related to Gag-pol polyprotein [Ustilago bromivora]|uniref:Related to Gag-pol polyprotein n=1 Tax=Ustilago bromivora TaxID=307758 RepID=A0A1K0FVS6_9BASI|nr:related to Gag-pol polyprotein [Ustilago bromivora]
MGRGPPDKDCKSVKLHGHEFILAEHLIQAALEDGPIGFMLLDTPPLSLLAFGFVPTGANRGVEMEVEADEPVTVKDIPELYQHLWEVFDEVEADKLPPHTEHNLWLESAKGSRPPQGPLYLRGPKEMAKLRKYLDKNLAKGFIQLFLLCKARIYSKLDLKAAYNLIHIANRDEWKTVFGTQLRLYEYLVMLFGLVNAPAHFQSFINHIFRNIIGIYVVIYLDDFLIFSDMEEGHINHITEILICLKKHQLFVKLSKSHFACITKPLMSLVKPTEQFKKFELPEDATQAFHKLIQAFTTAGVLKHFDYHLPTQLETDASDFAIAGVLKQEHKGCWHPVDYYSRKMASAEKNYKIHDKELLAMVACLTQWHHMLAGLPSQLVILTDHKALKYFKSQCCITGRQARWADMQPAGEEQEHNVRQLLPSHMFEEVKDKVDPKDTNRMTVSDATSILVAATPTMESIASQGLLGLARTFQPLDKELQEMHTKRPFELKDGLWHKDKCLVIPRVTMPGKTNECRTQSTRETPQHQPYGLLQPLSTPERPWGSISLDFIEGLPLSKGYDSILVIVDQLTKYTVMVPMTKSVTAEQTAMLLKTNFFPQFGALDHIVSDRGWQFISKSWSAFISSLGAKHSLSMAYHPQTNGQTE